MKRSLRRQWIINGCLFALFSSMTGVSNFVLAGRIATVTVKVTVVEKPQCTINGGRVIEVDFGDVIVPRIDGNHYMKEVNYSLECKGQLTNAMQLAIQGNPTAFDNTALKTSVDGFGISMRVNGEPLAINSSMKFVYPNKPVLQAVPVKRAGVDLPGGEFSAGATLIVYYQ